MQFNFWKDKLSLIALFLTIVVAQAHRGSAQELVLSERLFVGKPTLTEQLLGGKYTSPFGVYAKQTTEKGITLIPQSGEGKVQTIEAGDRYAAGMVDAQIPGAHYFYFKLATRPAESVVDLAIEYFDGGKGQVMVAYDAKESGFKSCPPIELTGGQTWNLVVYRLTDAIFTKRCNGGDFRVGNAPEGFAIGAVAVLPAREYAKK